MHWFSVSRPCLRIRTMPAPVPPCRCRAPPHLPRVLPSACTGARHRHPARCTPCTAPASATLRRLAAGRAWARNLRAAQVEQTSHVTHKTEQTSHVAHKDNRAGPAGLSGGGRSGPDDPAATFGKVRKVRKEVQLGIA